VVCYAGGPPGVPSAWWHAVKEIDKRRLQREVGTPCYDGLRLLAVDEVAIHKGHTYLTTVLDLETGRIVWVGKGRTEATLASFFAELTPEQLKSIEAVASDMASGFRKRHRREDGGDRGIGRSHSPEPHRQGDDLQPGTRGPRLHRPHVRRIPGAFDAECHGAPEARPQSRRQSVTNSAIYLCELITRVDKIGESVRHRRPE
jgi:hypothetical protein